MKKERRYDPRLVIFVILLFIIMFFLANLSGDYTRVEGLHNLGARYSQLCASGSVRIIDMNKYVGDTYQECIDQVWVTKHCPSGHVAVHRVSADARTRWIQCIHPSARYSR